MQKICKKCLELKDILDFHKQKTSKDGHCTICKLCAIEKAKKSYRENRDKILSDKNRYLKAKQWKANNPDKIKAYEIKGKPRKRKWVEDNWEKIKEQQRLYSKNNPDKIKGYAQKGLPKRRVWVEKNKERLKIQRTEYNKANREKINLQIKEYRDKNKEKISFINKKCKSKPEVKEKINIINRNRAALKKASGEKISIQQIKSLKIQQGNRCFYCDCVLVKYHQEHIIPISKGGEHKINNIVLACPKCNLAKGNIDPEEFVNKILERKAG